MSTPKALWKRIPRIKVNGKSVPVDFNKLTNQDYYDALVVGITKLVEDGKLKLQDIIRAK